jgi:replication fork clamp-binding protein CrfC
LSKGNNHAPVTKKDTAQFNTINHTDRMDNPNHFKITKKQSMQNYVSTSMVPSLKGNKLVSNVASISQSQVGAHTLKSRYGRSKGEGKPKSRMNSRYKDESGHGVFSP